MTWIDEQPTEKIAAALEKYRADESPIIRECKDAAFGNESYGLWLALANVAMIRAVGLGVWDIGDWSWSDAGLAAIEVRGPPALTRAQQDLRRNGRIHRT